MKKICQMIFLLFLCYGQVEALEKITFPSTDSLPITADIYITQPDTAPFILLFHQAGFSRGEYREIAPKLNQMSFNAMAIDQRSGGEVNQVINETAKRAAEKNLSDSYLDAIPDMKAAITYAKEKFAKGKFIIWGSSYSAALVLKLAGDDKKTAHGVLAFSPGEYFNRLGKSETYVAKSAKNITVPVFITSAKSEKNRWFGIYKEIPSLKKTYFLPATNGIHGSRALWESTPEQKGYWDAVKIFLQQFKN